MTAGRFKGAFIVCPNCKSTKVREEITYVRTVTMINAVKVEEHSKIVDGARNTVCNSCGHSEKETKSVV